ncbi:major facilitator superfamily domain-containing protein 10-like [Amphiura filiformis]|uniref:major facilitator superfamily domain-containing protein 10-like n=1 Tax=Amphiura filiformis TaxID=82378 RepID=UPI003B215CB6
MGDTQSEDTMNGHVEDINGKGTAEHESNMKEEEIDGRFSRRAIMVVFLSLLLDLLAFTMILPLLPSLLDYYAQHDKGDGWYSMLQSGVNHFREFLGIPDTERYNSVLFGGIIGSLFSFLQFVASPVIGAASDVYGRRPLMMLTMVGITSSYVMWALSHNFQLFVLARIVGGISKGNVSLSTTIITDVSTRKTRGKGMAMIGISFSLGFIVGPMIGALFARSAAAQGGAFYVQPALFALFLAAADVLFVYMYLDETLPEEKRAQSFGNSFKEAQNLINPVSLFCFSAVKKTSKKDMSMLRLLGFIYFLYLFIFSGLEFTLTFLVHKRFQYTSIQQGRMFVFMGLIMALVQGGFVRRIKPGKEKRMAVMGMVILMPSFLMIANATTTTLFYAGLALFAFASASVVPCMTTLVSVYGSADQKGTIMGIFRSLGALSRAFGPVVSSAVYWAYGASTCYIAGSILLVVPLFLFTMVKPQKMD